ncbi:MAG: hypothetical protein DMG62_12080 [Acidobacteria bacterium]|nr:MAG: hypothetical protein DMG62_12080 [Acidobacteriota bacterium]
MLPFPLAGSRHAMKIANALTRPLRTAAANRAERTAFILVRPGAALAPTISSRADCTIDDRVEMLRKRMQNF